MSKRSEPHLDAPYFSNAATSFGEAQSWKVPAAGHNLSDDSGSCGPLAVPTTPENATRVPALPDQSINAASQPAPSEAMTLIASSDSETRSYEKSGDDPAVVNTPELGAILAALASARERYRRNRLANYQLYAEIVQNSWHLRKSESLWSEYCKAAPSQFAELNIKGRRPKPDDRQSIRPVVIHALGPTTRQESLKDCRVARALQVLIDEGIPPERLAQTLVDRHGPQGIDAEGAARRRQVRASAIRSENANERTAANSPLPLPGEDQVASKAIAAIPNTLSLTISLTSDKVNAVRKLRPGQVLYVHIGEPSTADSASIFWVGSFVGRVVIVG